MIYEMHVGTFTPEGTWEAAARELPRAGRPGHHRDRADAGRRVSRAVRLGLRRRQPLRAHAPLRRARRPAPVRRPRPCARPRRDPRRGLQPPRARRQLPAARSRPTTSPTATRTSGARRSTSTARAGGRCASSSSPTPATGSTSSTSTACASTPRSRSSTPRRTHILARDRRRARAAAPAAHRSSWWRRTSRRTRGWLRPPDAGRLRARRALERRLPPQRDGRADRPPRGVLQRLPRHAAGVRLGGEVRLPLPGPVVRLAEAAARHAALDLPPPRLRRVPREPRPGRQLGARAGAVHQLTRPGRLRAMTALLLLGPATPMLFQGQEFAARGALPLLRRPRAASWPRSVREGAAEFLRQFPSVAAPDDAAAASPIPTAPPPSSAASSIPPSAAARDELLRRCTATCCGCAARTRSSPRQRRGTASTARCWARRPSACASSRRHGGRPAAAREPRGRPALWPVSRSRCWRRPSGSAWSVALVERGPALRRGRHARCR